MYVRPLPVLHGSCLGSTGADLESQGGKGARTLRSCRSGYYKAVDPCRLLLSLDVRSAVNAPLRPLVEDE